MLVSVEIVSGCKVLKAWGVQVSEIVTLGDIYCGIVAGTIESGSSLQMPPELEDQPFICSIGQSQNGPFQDCPCSITARDAIEFAEKFVRYRVEPTDARLSTSMTATQGSPNAFSVLMSSQREIKFVQRVSSPRNKKEELANAVSSWLENKGVECTHTYIQREREREREKRTHTHAHRERTHAHI